MSANITRDILESHLQCPTKGHLKFAGEHGAASDYASLLAELREEVRTKAIAQVLSRHKEGQVLRHVRADADLLARGPTYLLDATAEDDGLSLTLDGKACQGPKGKTVSQPTRAVPVAGWAISKRNECDRLFICFGVSGAHRRARAGTRLRIQVSACPGRQEHTWMSIRRNYPEWSEVAISLGQESDWALGDDFAGDAVGESDVPVPFSFYS